MSLMNTSQSLSSCPLTNHTLPMQGSHYSLANHTLPILVIYYTLTNQVPQDPAYLLSSSHSPSHSANLFSFFFPSTQSRLTHADLLLFFNKSN